MSMDRMHEDRNRNESLAKSAVDELARLEFSAYARYGKTCPSCRGNEREDYGYVERGPDRGHEQGCTLRRILDEAGRP